MKMKQRRSANRMLAFASAVIMLLCACGDKSPEPQPDPTLEFNDSVFLREELAAHVRTMTPDDTVKVNISLSTGKTSALGVKLMIEEEYGIPVHICNAIDKRDFEKSDPYAREWYESNRAEGDPTFDENIDEARLEYIEEYQRMTEDIREKYERELFADVPFREGTVIDYRSNSVKEYSATAKELSELSQNEYVSYIYPWTESPVEPPESVTPACVFTDRYRDLEISVIFDKEKYSYGDTVNMQVSLYNDGDSAVCFEPICETGNNKVGDPDHKNGFCYIIADFLADEVSRRDLSCCYGYDAATTDLKPTGVLEPGETMSKTYAYTPHKSYEFLGEGVDRDSAWGIRVKIETVDGEKSEPYSFEISVPRADK